MSSILRALKKLENEPRHLEENRPLDNKFVPLADTEPQRTFSRTFMVMLGGGIVCGLVILAGWWLFSEKSQPPTAVTQNNPGISSKLNESPGPSLDMNNTPVKTVSENPVAPPSMEAVATPETAERVTEQEPAGAEEPIFPIITQEDVSSAAEEQTPEETVLPLKAPSLIKDESVVAPLRTPAKTVKVEIPKLKDPDMKLQAVTWSRVPQKRIAVINNRIMREGEMVSGYLINTINQDDVVLSQDGEKWKLLFR